MARRLTALAAALVLLAGCGGDDSDDPSGSPLADPAATEASPEVSVPDETGGLPADRDEAVRDTINAYIAAINAGDGAALCRLLAPDALDGVRLPEQGPDCASSLTHSIGFRGPGGTPVWKRTKLIALDPVAWGGDVGARATASVIHDFADRPEPSVEEDVIYLDRIGENGWLIAKPSATFYRAIGYPEPPLSSLTPP
jgi:hypothetical protein